MAGRHRAVYEDRAGFVEHLYYGYACSSHTLGELNIYTMIFQVKTYQVM